MEHYDWEYERFIRNKVNYGLKLAIIVDIIIPILFTFPMYYLVTFNIPGALVVTGITLFLCAMANWALFHRRG